MQTLFWVSGTRKARWWCHCWSQWELLLPTHLLPIDRGCRALAYIVVICWLFQLNLVDFLLPAMLTLLRLLSKRRFPCRCIDCIFPFFFPSWWGWLWSSPWHTFVDELWFCHHSCTESLFQRNVHLHEKTCQACSCPQSIASSPSADVLLHAIDHRLPFQWFLLSAVLHPQIDLYVQVYQTVERGMGPLEIVHIPNFSKSSGDEHTIDRDHQAGRSSASSVWEVVYFVLLEDLLLEVLQIEGGRFRPHCGMLGCSPSIPVSIFWILRFEGPRAPSPEQPAVLQLPTIQSLVQFTETFHYTSGLCFKSSMFIFMKK